MRRNMVVTGFFVAAGVMVGSTAAHDPGGPETKTGPLQISKTVTAVAPDDWVPLRLSGKRSDDGVVHNFAAPPADGDKAAGKILIARTGKKFSAKLERNLHEWYETMVQPDGRSSEEVGQIAKMKDDDVVVTFLDLPGTHRTPLPGTDRSIDREDYRLYGAHIVVGKEGTWIVTAFGPDRTMQQARKGVVEFVSSFHVD